MNEPIPPDAPLSPGSREKLRELGIVSMAHFAAAVSSAAPHLEALIGKGDYDAMLTFIEQRFPSLDVKEPLELSPFPLGALFEGVAPIHPIPSFDVEARDRLYLEAQKLRTAGRVNEAEKIEKQIELMTLNVSKGIPHPQ
jgi:hypothetical protein